MRNIAAAFVVVAYIAPELCLLTEVEIRQNLFACTLAKLKKGMTWFIQFTLYFSMKHYISIHFLNK